MMRQATLAPSHYHQRNRGTMVHSSGYKSLLHKKHHSRHASTLPNHKCSLKLLR
ncbi:hypothetical protein NECAME_11454 [Necator americanus]|uniref:Uncharacterized protein n=1 Tax=Necator americanus TaxID=51031 RepID=W2T5D3_NECAM|nr:hypothetical protein NECAME_11454 [Necator americanus]ETN76789.1 hypothetical protein NECAME_11454 [Necator americanus]